MVENEDRFVVGGVEFAAGVRERHFWDCLRDPRKSEVKGGATFC